MTQLLDAPALEKIISSSDILALKGNSEVRLVVLENQEYRLLVLNGAVQSVQYKPQPHAILFPHQRQLLKILPELKPNAEVLELGLGGGSALAHAARYYPKMKWTTVEKSMTVIDLYLDFFAPDIPHTKHQIACADGKDWLRNKNDQSFDLILCDVYAKIQRPLLVECSRHVKPDGWLVVNWLPHLHEQDSVDSFLKGVPELQDWSLKQDKVVGYRNRILRFQKPN